MAHPYVTKVTLKGGEIVLTVEFDASALDQAFEISGYATQNGGAFANFYQVKVPTELEDGTVVTYVTAPPLQEFKNGEDVTVVLRAARVWAVVLTQAKDVPQGIAPAKEGTTAEDGRTWATIKQLGWVSPAGTPTVSPAGTPAGDAGQAQAGGASFPSTYPGTPPANH